MKYLIIDCETLGIEDRSIILQSTFAIADTNWPSIDNDTLFDDQNILNIKYQVKPQAEIGRIVNKGTLTWWKQQDPEVYRRMLTPMSTDVHPRMGFDVFKDWLAKHDWSKRTPHYVWQRGTKDSDWLFSLWSEFLVPVDEFPWTYGRVRDIRTAVDVLGNSDALNGYPSNLTGLQQQIPNFQQHDSICDVKRELLILRQCGLLGQAF